MHEYESLSYKLRSCYGRYKCYEETCYGATISRST